MAKLVWDQIGEKIYETGAKNAVLYPIDANNAYSKGVAWNGLLGFDENPSGAEATKLYADDINYGTMYSAEEYGGTIRAYTYPDEFEECDGSAELVKGVTIGQQSRKMFGFCYRTSVGNDTMGNDFGYKLHLVYGCKASPSSKTHDTINDSPAAVEFSWEITCTPVGVKSALEKLGFKPTCVLEIDSTKFTTEAQKAKLNTLVDILYGTDADPQAQIEDTTARLPLPDEIYDLFNGQ